MWCRKFIFCLVLEKRLREWCEERDLLVDEQMGFREGRSTRDAIFVLDEVVRQRGRGEKVFMFFLDISKAYPSVWRGCGGSCGRWG